MSGAAHGDRTPPKIGFDHAAVSVPDIEASIGWYDRMLGFRLLRRFARPEGLALGAMLGRDDMLIELFQPADPVPLPEARRHPDTDLGLLGNKHVAFRTADLPGMSAWFEVAGADIAHRVDATFGQALFIRDNSGNVIEFVARRVEVAP